MVHGVYRNRRKAHDMAMKMGWTILEKRYGAKRENMNKEKNELYCLKGHEEKLSLMNDYVRTAFRGGSMYPFLTVIQTNCDMTE